MDNETHIETTDNNQMLDYILRHYWDLISFRDKEYIYSSDFVDKLKHYVGLLQSTSDENADKSLNLMFTKAICHGEIFCQLIRLLDKMYNDRDSLFYNEKRGVYVLNKACNSGAVSEDMKSESHDKLKWLLLNQTGEMAENFVFCNTNEEVECLYRIRAEYLLLYFYVPYTTDIQETNKFLLHNPILSLWESEERLKILAIYPEKDDVDNWIAFAESERKFIHGYDREGLILKNKLYDIRNLPCLYLLDRNKRVILRNCKMLDIKNFFEKNIAELS